MNTDDMTRINVYVPAKYIAAAKSLRQRTGVTLSEMVRRGLRTYLLEERERLKAKPPQP